MSRSLRRSLVGLATLAGGLLGAPMLLPETTAADRLPRRDLARPGSRFTRIDGVEIHHEVHGPESLHGAPGTSSAQGTSSAPGTSSAQGTSSVDDSPGPVGTEGTVAEVPTLLLAHHFYGSTPVWDRLTPLLSDRYRLISWDRPGFGLTERPLHGSLPDNPYTRASAARLGWALLDSLGIERTVLVGASAGGTNVLEMYAQAPERVRALILLAPAITGDVGAPPPLRQLLRAAPLRRLGPRVVERAIGDITRERSTRSWADPSRANDEDLAAYRDLVRVEGWSRGLWEVMTAEAPPDLRDVLRSITVPTLVVTGAQDRTIAPRWGRWVAGTIPGGRFELLPDCGHVPHQERPQELARILRPFLAEVLGGEA